MSDKPDPAKQLAGGMRANWQRFVDVYEEYRPELYRYCRYLTRSAFDAEDLVQDTFARAFVTLGMRPSEPPNPRAWFFRVASNLWIDRVRRTREIAMEELPEVAAEASDARLTREAAGTLLSKLSPQERAAVVLKDAFDLSLDEIATTLSTTEGAVKAALSRGRGKLAAPVTAAMEAKTPAPAVLDAFCAAFNARDLDRLAGLLLDTATAEIVGINAEYGPDEARRGSFWGALQPLTWNYELDCGVHDQYLEGYESGSPRAELRWLRGEPVFLFWYGQKGGEVVRDVGRAEIEGDRIARWRNYFFSPDVVAEVCNELGVPHRSNGYRYWRKTS
jgi:RNA polymerase sigma-70 factor (ECF subfamily)